MSPLSAFPDPAPSGGVRRDRLAALASRVGPSLEGLRGRPGLTFLLLLVFMVGVSLLSFQWVLNALLHTRNEVAVPDLSGKTLEQALDILSPLQLSLAKDGVEFNENFPPGAILRQAPPAGLTVREGKVIHAVISSGGQVAFIPEIVGKTLAEAQNLLRVVGMAPGALSQAYSQIYAEGVVVEQSPAPGAVGGPGQMVDLKVSKGAPPEGTLLMPDFLNRPATLAAEWADGAGVKLQTTEEVHADLVPGIVLRQTPAADAALTEGQTVSLVLSSAGDAPGKGETRWVRYQTPRGGDRVKVKVILRDSRGEKVLSDEVQAAGALIELPVSPQGPGRVRIYLGGVLVEERVLE